LRFRAQGSRLDGKAALQHHTGRQRVPRGGRRLWSCQRGEVEAIEDEVPVRGSKRCAYDEKRSVRTVRTPKKAASALCKPAV
jgi:hypothetical protein